MSFEINFILILNKTFRDKDCQIFDFLQIFLFGIQIARVLYRNCMHITLVFFRDKLFLKENSEKQKSNRLSYMKYLVFDHKNYCPPRNMQARLMFIGRKILILIYIKSEKLGVYICRLIEGFKGAYDNKKYSINKDSQIWIMTDAKKINPF